MKERTLTEPKKRILEEMKKNPQISNRQLSLILDVHTRTIEQHVRYLREGGFIRRVRPNHRGKSRGHWEVLK